MTPYQNLAKNLHALGATIFACGAVGRNGKWDPKIPTRTGWQKGYPLDEVLAHISKPNTHIGLIPHSIGCLVVDVDAQIDDAVDKTISLIGKPAMQYKTSPDTHPWKEHLCYPDGGQKHGNKRIYLDGEHVGELRGANGYIRIPRCDETLRFAEFQELAKSAEAVDISPMLEKGPKTPQDAPDDDLLANAPPKAEKPAEANLDADADAFAIGQRNNELNRRVFQCFLRDDKAGATKALNDAIAAGLPRLEADSTFKSARDAALAERKRTKPAKQQPKEDGAPAKLRSRYHAWLWAGYDGPKLEKGSDEAKEAFRKLKAKKADLKTGCTMRGLGAVLSILHIDVRHNIRKDADEWKFREEGHFDWQPIDDRAEDMMREFIRDSFTLTFMKDTKDGQKPVTIPWPSAKMDAWRRSLNALLADREQDPFMAWLESLPAWDGKPRIETVLQELFGARQCELTAWASGHLFLGAAKRAVQPGHKLDVVPVLIGPQGIGKSSFLRSLLPPHEYCDAWFNDGISLNDKPQALVEGVAGTVIVELAEMAGATRADLDRMKAFISRTNDGHVRSAYARRAEDRPRRFLLVATADRMDSLPQDSQGLRRFCPVVVPNRASSRLAHMNENRTQLWAEALARVRRGEAVHLHGELEAESMNRAKSFMANDPVLEDLIESRLAGAAKPIRMMVIARAINHDCHYSTDHDYLSRRNPKHRFQTRHIQAALRRFGWEPVLRREAPGAKPVRGWKPPNGWDSR